MMISISGVEKFFFFLKLSHSLMYHTRQSVPVRFSLLNVLSMQGVQVDRMDIDPSVEEAKSSPSCKQELEREKPCALLRQQKHLNTITEHALRKNQPLIILNLMHEKVPFLMAEDLSGTCKMEQTCLQALSMHVFPGGLHVEITLDSMEDEKEEACLSNGSVSTTNTPVTTLPESSLPEIVSCSINHSLV